MRIFRCGALLLSLSVMFGSAWAQSEPTIDQIYREANAGRLAEADRMIDQVLQAHPKSAKAHFVKAELAARESDALVARQELAAAERLAPGLPFAKPEAVAALRDEVGRARATAGSPQRAAQAAAPVQAPGSSRLVPMAMLLLAVVGLAGFFLFRRRAGPPQPVPGPAATMPGAWPAGSSGPMAPAGMPFPAAAPPSLGSTLAGGLATGLAVGAGALAAEEIGRRMFGHHDEAAVQRGTLAADERGMLDPGVNANMGGNDFGINDAGSWDDASGSADVGGGDWDT